MRLGSRTSKTFRKQRRLRLENGEPMNDRTNASTLFLSTSYVILERHAWLLNILNFVNQLAAFMELQTREIRVVFFFLFFSSFFREIYVQRRSEERRLVEEIEEYGLQNVIRMITESKYC